MIGGVRGTRRRFLIALSMTAAVALGAIEVRPHPWVAPATASANPDSSLRPDSVRTPAASPGTRDYVTEVRANFTPENRVYWTTRSAISLLWPFYSILIGALLLFTGFSARLRDIAHARAKGRYLSALLYFTLLSIVSSVFDLPLAWYSGFALEHRFGLSTQSLGAWLGDQGKDLLVNVVFFGIVPLFMLAYLAIEKSPRRWWLWLALGTLPVIVIGSLIGPVLIDPLYNKFTPLRDQQLKTKILDLAAKAEIPSRRVYEVDKSRQTKKYNAYVSGFGASQRIVLWDTTLKGMKDDEILFVMGHEMGHYKLAHIWKGIVFSSLLSFGLFYFSGRLTRWAIERFGQRWRIQGLADIASLPLLLATLSIVSLVAQPLDNGFERAIEHEADVFGVEVTHLNDAGARAFIKLGSQNKSNPEPPLWIKLFQYTHPPLIERIRFAESYRPWEEGKPNRAFKPRPAGRASLVGE